MSLLVRLSVIAAALSWAVWMLAPTMLGDRLDLPEALTPQSRRDVDLGIDFGGGMEIMAKVHVHYSLRDYARQNAWSFQNMADDEGLDVDIRASGNDLHARAPDRSHIEALRALVAEHGHGYIYVGLREHDDGIDHIWWLTEERILKIQENAVAQILHRTQEHATANNWRSPEVLPNNQILLRIPPDYEPEASLGVLH